MADRRWQRRDVAADPIVHPLDVSAPEPKQEDGCEDCEEWDDEEWDDPEGDWEDCDG